MSLVWNINIVNLLIWRVWISSVRYACVNPHHFFNYKIKLYFIKSCHEKEDFLLWRKMMVGWWELLQYHLQSTSGWYTKKLACTVNRSFQQLLEKGINAIIRCNFYHPIVLRKVTLKFWTVVYSMVVNFMNLQYEVCEEKNPWKIFMVVSSYISERICFSDIVGTSQPPSKKKAF